MLSLLFNISVTTESSILTIAHAVNEFEMPPSYSWEENQYKSLIYISSTYLLTCYLNLAIKTTL
jgi:hypothetical protein